MVVRLLFKVFNFIKNLIWLIKKLLGSIKQLPKLVKELLKKLLFRFLTFVKSKELFAVISFVAVTLAYTLSPIISLGLFFDLVALSFSSIWLYTYLSSKGKWSIVFFIIFLTSLNNFIDELFFNPAEYDWNEYTAFSLIVLITILNLKRWKR